MNLLRPPVVLYMRVSSDAQRDRNTIDGQETALRSALARESLEPVATYSDDGVTGDMPWEERPAARQLLQDARAGAFRTVFVYLYDRFSRDLYEGLVAARALKAAGVQPVSLLEPFDISTPFGEYMFAQSLNNAQLHKAQFLERSRQGTIRLAATGCYLGGIVPYGYEAIAEPGNSRRKHLAPSDREAVPGMSESDVVRYIYHALAVDGATCQTIADRLNALNVPPAYVRDGIAPRRGERAAATAGIWRAGRIRNLVTVTTYKGIYQYGKRTNREDTTIIEAPCIALVTPETWQAAQETLRRNMLFSPSPTSRKYLLRGKIICGVCGLTYSGAAANRPNGSFEYYYKCNGRAQYRGLFGARGERCYGKVLKGTDTDNAVWDAIDGFLRHPDAAVREMAGKEDTAPVRGADAPVAVSPARLVELIAAKATERAEMVTMRRKKQIDDADLARGLAEIETETAILAGLLKSAKGEEASLLDAQNKAREAAAVLKEAAAQYRGAESLTEEERREIVSRLLESVRVDTDRETGTAHLTMTFHFTETAKSVAPIRTDILSYRCYTLQRFRHVRRGGRWG